MAEFVLLATLAVLLFIFLVFMTCLYGMLNAVMTGRECWADKIWPDRWPRIIASKSQREHRKKMRQARRERIKKGIVYMTPQQRADAVRAQIAQEKREAAKAAKKK